MIEYSVISFYSIICNNRINDSATVKFVEYEVLSKIRIMDILGNITDFQVKIWKRYSDFEVLNKQITSIKQFKPRLFTLYRIDPRVYLSMIRKLKFPSKYELQNNLSNFIIEKRM